MARVLLLSTFGGHGIEGGHCDGWPLVAGRSRDWYRPEGRSAQASVGSCGHRRDLRGGV